MIDHSNSPLIYESPDEGNTVYARHQGSKDRWLVKQNIGASEFGTLGNSLKQNQLWSNIRRAAQTNPALQDALDRAIIIYNLTKHE